MNTLGGLAARELMKRPEDRDRAGTWRLCPRPICDRGRVWDTVGGVRKPPGYTCSVCGGLGFVLVVEVRAETSALRRECGRGA